jgi:hypothetical protein
MAIRWAVLEMEGMDRFILKPTTSGNFGRGLARMGSYEKIIELGLVVIAIIVAGLGSIISFMKGQPKRRWRKGPPRKRSFL